MDAIRSMHNRGINPNSAVKPQCGTRNGRDIIAAKSSTSSHRRIPVPDGTD